MKKIILTLLSLLISVNLFAHRTSLGSYGTDNRYTYAYFFDEYKENDVSFYAVVATEKTDGYPSWKQITTKFSAILYDISEKEQAENLYNDMISLGLTPDDIEEKCNDDTSSYSAINSHNYWVQSIMKMPPQKTKAYKTTSLNLTDIPTKIANNIKFIAENGHMVEIKFGEKSVGFSCSEGENTEAICIYFRQYQNGENSEQELRKILTKIIQNTTKETCFEIMKDAEKIGFNLSDKMNNRNPPAIYYYYDWNN